jgi:NTE family protein
MVIQPTEKAWGADYLRFGLSLASDFSGDNAFNALVQYRKSWLNRLGGEWTTEAQIGQNTRVWTEFYQPLNETGQWFIAPNALIGQQTRGAFVGDDRVADYLIKVGQAGVDVGASLGTWGQLRGGAVWSKVDARVDTGSPVLPSIKETTAGLRAALFVDQLDHAWFPSDGYALTGTFYGAMTSFGSALNYQRLEGGVRAARSWGPHTLNVAVKGGTALGSDMPAYESFALGGPLNLSGYRVNQFSGRDYAFGRLMYYKRIFPLPDLLGSGLYAGASAEVGQIRNRFDDSPSPGTLWSTSAFLGADTFLGPAFLGFGYGGADNWSLYLLLGSPW